MSAFLGDSRRCSKCGVYKPLSGFDRSKYAPRGVHSRCKTCRSVFERRKYRDRTDRFWKTYYKKCVKAGDCMEWAGDGSKTPRCHWKRKRVSIARLVYQLARGPVPDDMVVLHTCNNRQCMRPSHLELGTPTDLDVKRYNSAPTGERHNSRTHPERLARGERNGFAKLTEANVRAIRQEYGRDGIGLKELAARFGVTKQAVCYIVNRKTWKHVSAD